MSFNHHLPDASLLDSQWKQEIWREFICEKPVSDEFSFKELLTWCNQHLKMSRVADDPLWTEQLEELLWQFEGAGLIKQVAANFSGTPCFCRSGFNMSIN